MPDALKTSDLKRDPAHAIYLRALMAMTPEARLRRAFELSDFTRELFRHGLRTRFPDLSETDFQRLYLERLALCHNRNY